MLLRDCSGVPVEELLVGTGASVEPVAPVAQIVTAGAATYVAENLLRGILIRDPSGASRSDVTPSAAQLVAAAGSKYGGVKVGMIIPVLIVNCADAAEVITVTVGAGVTLGATPGTCAIGQNASRMVLFRFTNVTPASEAVVIY